MLHKERALIGRLFQTGTLSPADWDALFAHLRRGCPSCSQHYSDARRAAARPQDGEAATLTAQEHEVIARVLTQRASSERRLGGRASMGASLAAIAAVASAALLLVLPHGPGDGTADSKGGSSSPTGVTLSCQPAESGAPAPRSEEARRRSPVRCVPGPLVVETYMRADVAARQVSVLVVDRDLDLVGLWAADARPGVTVPVEVNTGTREGETKVFVLWTVAPLSREQIDGVIDQARRGSRTLESLEFRRLPGVVADRAEVLVVKVAGAN